MTDAEQIAAWDAEDKAEALRCAARDAYYTFLTKVEAQNTTNAYLTDEGVDQENSAHHEYNSLGFWRTMLTSAEGAAWERAAEAGVVLDL